VRGEQPDPALAVIVKSANANRAVELVARAATMRMEAA
jgi:hypothetical protein